MHLDDSADRVRVLFVDDDPLVIRGLRRTLATRALPWELHFRETGEAALEFLDRTRVAVVVSDFFMPGMDGAAVLARVQETRPDVARIVLSGAEDPNLILRMAPVAHLCLSKPFETSTLVAAISQCIEMHALLARPTLLTALGTAGDWPEPPPTYIAVTRARAREGVAAPEIRAILDAHPALSTRMARLASYAPSHAPRVRSRLSSYLAGEPSALRALVLLSEMTEALEGSAAPGPRFSIEAFERHSVGTAHLAAGIIGRQGAVERAFFSGLLHDIGEILLAARKPEEFLAARTNSAQSGIPSEEAERSILGVSHAEVGACLLWRYGFPLETVEAALHHHAPATLDVGGLDVSGAVYVGSLLSRDAEAPLGQVGHPDKGRDRLARGYDASRLDEWRRAARELA